MRKKKTKKQKQEEHKRRYEAIKNLMSTFAMSTVAVVAVVTLIPASPKAEIIKSEALSEEITYQVNITDEENALDPSSLFVVLENQLEHYEQSISLGENSGFFDNLNNNTQYRLSVYGSKGFGQERLDTMLVTTKQKIGGTLLAVSPNTEDIVGDYIAEVSIYDPDMKYSSITLYYGQTWEGEGEIFYDSEIVTGNRSDIPLIDIWGSDPIHVYLEGITVDGSEILDEMWITPPFELYASAYLERIGSKEIGFHLYSDMYLDKMEFELYVYKNNILVKTQTFIANSDYHEAGGYILNGLTPNTNYMIEIYGNYQNPQTLVNEHTLISIQEVTTLHEYTYTYTSVEYDTYYEVNISIDDPNDYFQTISFETFDTSGEFESYLNGNLYSLEIDGTTKTYTFTIDKPIVESYKIYIRINNQLDSSIFKILEIIESE